MTPNKLIKPSELLYLKYMADMLNQVRMANNIKFDKIETKNEVAMHVLGATWPGNHYSLHLLELEATGDKPIDSPFAYLKDHYLP